MSTRRLGWMPIYTGDFLASTNGFTLEEVGAVIRLAIAQWERGLLPFDQKELARICNVDLARFKKLWPQLSPRYSPFGEGAAPKGLVDEALEQVRRRSRSAYERRCESAHATNLKRLSKQLHDQVIGGSAVLHGDRDGDRSGDRAESESESDIRKDQESPVRARAAVCEPRRARPGDGMAEQELRVRKLLADAIHCGDTDAEIAKIAQASLEVVRAVRGGAPLASDVPTEGSA